ncbi:MAG: glycosyltransferase family 2 protein [Pyrinomonadaceae bacterium]
MSVENSLTQDSPNSPQVSVITPLYNSAAFIRETLDSLLRQTYPHWKSILVDDGSTDDTAQVVEPYLADSRFRYIRQENQGIAGARNTGLRAASGEWVCLLDHDDRWLPEKLERQLRFTLAHNYDITGTDAFIVRGAERWIYSRGFPAVAEELARAATDESVDVFGLLIRVNFICTCSVMLRRALFEKHGLLDAQAVPADDYEMWLRCLPEARLGFLGEPLVEYFSHERNFSRNEVLMIEKIIYVLRKHRARHAGDAVRRTGFDAALLFQYEALFTKLLDAHQYGGVFSHALPLLSEGAEGRRVFSKAVGAPALARLVHSIQHRLGLARV